LLFLFAVLTFLFADHTLFSLFAVLSSIFADQIVSSLPFHKFILQFTHTFGIVPFYLLTQMNQGNINRLMKNSASYLKY